MTESEGEFSEDSPPGLFMVNASGEMVALHTESGGGDHELLKEYIRENEIPGVKVNDDWDTTTISSGGYKYD